MSKFVGSAARGVALGLLLAACSLKQGESLPAEPDASSPEPAAERQGEGAAIREGTVEEFCRKTAAGFGTFIRSCCEDADRASSKYRALAPVFEGLERLCVARLGGSVARGRMRYDSWNAQECFKAHASLFEPEYVCLKRLPDDLEKICSAAFAGSGKSGAPCIADFECESDLWCRGATDESEGRCAVPAKDGESCASSGTALQLSAFWRFGDHPHCGSASYCSSVTGKCVAFEFPIVQCERHEECMEGSRCFMNKCGPLAEAEVGLGCKSHLDCGPRFMCSPTTQTCQRKRPHGAACTDDEECSDRCERSGATGMCAQFCGSDRRR